MRIEFFGPRHRGDSAAPKNVLAEAEIHFDAMTVGAGGETLPSPFSGLKLVGFTVWEGDRGVFATFPTRPYGAGSERRYFDYLRPSDDYKSEAARSHLSRIKRWICEEYKAWDEAGRPGAYEPTRTAPDREEY